MRIEFTWNKPSGSKAFVGFSVNPDDPHRNDEELQLAKAMAGAIVHFQHQSGESVPANQISYRIIRT